jgi:chemotaxis protein MotA
MKIILGTIIIILGFAVSLFELNQSLSSYWDLVAFAMVLSGTISVAILTSPSHKLKEIWLTLKYFFKSKAGLRSEFVNKSVNYIDGRYQGLFGNSLAERILRDGKELIDLGLSQERIEGIINGRTHKWLEDNMKVVNWVRGLAKYPPAFGLAATVLGLIQVMNGLSENADPRVTALKMALALIATFYGIIVANLIVAPIGDRVRANVLEEYHLGEIAQKAVFMKAQQESKVVAREILLAHLGESEKEVFFNMRSVA